MENSFMLELYHTPVSVYIIGFLTCVLTLDSFGCLSGLILYIVV